MTSFATHGSVSAALPRPSLPHPPNVGCKNITGLSLAIIPHSSPRRAYLCSSLEKGTATMEGLSIDLVL